MKKSYGGVLDGVRLRLITIETDISQGIPNITIVGLADKAVSESKERIRCCLNILKFPIKKITISLSPADIKKTGSALDLSILVGILSSKMNINFERFIWYGELGLDGSIKKSLGSIIACIDAYKQGKIVICSSENDLSSLSYCNYICINNIFELFTTEFEDLCNNFKITYKQQSKDYIPKIQELLQEEIDEKILMKYNLKDLYEWLKQEIDPFAHIYGQDLGKLAISLAAIGRHHCLFIGPQGVGKSLLCKSIQNILPPLEEEEMIESQAIYSLGNERWIRFRSPHSTCSLAALIGTSNSPGEISLAHNGVLYLDELPEYNTSAIESLKVPLEEGKVYISRAHAKDVYPAKILFIASMNPCKCGYFFKSQCKCKNYMMKISAPILDRIDISIILDNVPNLQKIEHQNHHRKIFLSYIRKKYYPMQISEDLQEDVKKYILSKNLSIRSLHKILNLMHTLACYENSEIKKSHLYAAIMLRQI